MGSTSLLTKPTIPLCVLVLLFQCGSASLEVKTPYGTYKGYLTKSKGGRELSTFKGIPYAQPPVGSLRFKDPMKLERSEGVFNADEEKTCIHEGLSSGLNKPNASKTVGTEDCLYLNIYRPKDVPLEKPLPVLFWIHGGGYTMGSGGEDFNGPKILLDKNRDMVLVTINYRLGILGFLNTNETDLPQNLGYKDQSMALKWVNENIKSFGGDPNSITIGGISAGAASVSHHMISKASKGLFHRAISNSGTADCSWATKSVKEANEIAFKLFSHLECPLESKKLIECLMEQSAENLIDSLNILKVNHTGLIMHLTPVVEEDSPTAFMTKESIEEGSDVPWLTGVTSEEGLGFYQLAALFDPSMMNLSILNEQYKNIFPVVAYYNPSRDGLTEDIKDFYFGEKAFDKETVKEYVKLLSDIMFNHGLIVSARKHKGRLYMYKLSYRGKNSIALIRSEDFKDAVTHGDDMYYLFDIKTLGSTELEGKDLEIANLMADMWYSFIKSGDPTPECHLWEESEGGVKYLDIGNDNIIMTSNMFQKRNEFWDKMDTKWKSWE